MGTPYFDVDYENASACSNSNGLTQRTGRFGRSHAIRDPQTVQIYLVGGGIASLAAATYLIKDAHVEPNNIHILESSSIAGGSVDAAGDPDNGYIVRGARMLNFSYVCLYDLLDRIPARSDQMKSVREEIDAFNALPGNKISGHSRLVRSKGQEGPTIEDVHTLGLTLDEKVDLVKMMVQSEHSLTKKGVEDCFPPEFFNSNFWYMWATMFHFQPWHSAVEFHRYLYRFIHELPRLNTMAGVQRTPFNQHDSIICPITTHLKKLGVDFQYNTTVTDLSFTDDGAATVKSIHAVQHGGREEFVTRVKPADLVCVTLGSMTSGSKYGTNNVAPDPISLNPTTTSDGAWALWKNLSERSQQFGNPNSFNSRIAESSWGSFTVTIKDPEDLLFTLLQELTTKVAGTGGMTTLKDSNWLISLVVPHQPHFAKQPDDVKVFWGYGMSIWKDGNYVKKSMASCTGEEIMTEILSHLRFPRACILETTNCIPCVMPYITSPFLTRNSPKSEGVPDRPQVVPEGSVNLAFLGQFVEIPDDVVFTIEYSVRGAQKAVFDMMGLDKQPKSIYKGSHHLTVLREGLHILLK